MNKSRTKKEKGANLVNRDVIEKSEPIRVHWSLRFLIEAERLGSGDLSKVPFQIVNIEEFCGNGFIPHDIQIQAWIVIFNGQFLFLVSGTGSGKTLAIIPGIIEEVLKKKEAHCLIMYPMKALAQDQEWRVREWCSELGLTIQRYDSSVSDEAKFKIRENPGDILIITPDTLMMSINATQNDEWFSYLTSPSMIWMDEFHAMSGTLGTALCYLMRILYQLRPALRVFITSTTLANAAEIAQLFPHSPKIIEGKSRHGTVKFHVGTIKDLKAALEVVLYDEGQFLVFIENKQRIEEFMTKYNLLVRRINRYHADLADIERHLILSQFSKKELKGLLCTSAVSLGVDLPSVKNIILYGFPRSFSLLFQEMGRGTRDPESSGRVFLLLDHSKLIDNYYSTQLEELERDIRSYRSDPMIIDLLNKKILRGMVLFAIKLGINTPQGLMQVFNEALKVGKLEQVLTWLLIQGLISKNNDAYTYFKEYGDDYIYGFASTLRPGFPKFTYKTKGEEIEMGYINAKDIPFRACVGNYYTKENQSYKIVKIDKVKREILIERNVDCYRSRNLVNTTVSMIRELKFKKFENIKIRLADFKVQIRPSMFRNYKILEDQSELLESEKALKGRTFELNFEIRGVIFEFPQDIELPLSFMVLYQLSKVILQNATLMINISENEVDPFQNKGKRMLYFLDRSCPTGVSQQLYENVEDILNRTYHTLKACPCIKGCDKCSIPVESNFLMPNFDTHDRFRKEEMLTILRRFLHESGSVE